MRVMTKRSDVKRYAKARGTTLLEVFLVLKEEDYKAFLKSLDSGISEAREIQLVKAIEKIAKKNAKQVSGYKEIVTVEKGKLIDSYDELCKADRVFFKDTLVKTAELKKSSEKYLQAGIRFKNYWQVQTKIYKEPIYKEEPENTGYIEKFKNYMLENKVSQAEMAEYMNISVTTLLTIFETDICAEGRKRMYRIVDSIAFKKRRKANGKQTISA